MEGGGVIKVLNSLCLTLLISFISNYTYADCNSEIQTNAVEYCSFNLAKIRELAENGDKEAQFRLGLKYHKGEDLPKNDIEAAKWYQKASDQNQLDARHNLALLYKTGNGVKKDLKVAFELEKSAAELGQKYSQNTLGLYFLDGIGTAQNISEGIKWLTTSANQNLADAADNLGKVYARDKYVAIDNKKAFYWYQKAAQLGNSSSQLSTCLLYKKGLGVEKNVNKALEYCRLSAQNGYLDAQVVTGLLLRGNVEDIKPNYEESFFWLKKAADRGDTGAYFLVGVAYQAGVGVERSNIQARKWFELAAKHGDNAAQNRLNQMH